MFHLWLWYPLSTPSPTRPPCPNSMSPDNFPTRASLSPPLASSPSVFRLFAVSPLAPVVTLRPPVRLNGGWCHAAPGVLASVPMFGVPPPRPMRMAVLGSGVGGGA